MPSHAVSIRYKYGRLQVEKTPSWFAPTMMRSTAVVRWLDLLLGIDNNQHVVV